MLLSSVSLAEAAALQPLHQLADVLKDMYLLLKARSREVILCPQAQSEQSPSRTTDAEWALMMEMLHLRDDYTA
jgi:hypothetical protein